MNLAHKVVVITGGSQGFGRALAQAFARAQARVVISSNHAETLSAAAKELGVDHFAADVTSYTDLAALRDHTVDKYGGLDVWINNAGIQIAPAPVEEVDIGKLRRLFDINYFGYFYGCQVALEAMKRGNSGVLININSTAGLDGKPGLSAYVSSKFAIKGLTQSIREELKGTGVLAYGIFPGGMQTDIYKEKYPADIDDYMSVDYAVEKVMANLAAADPEPYQIIRRPKA